MIKYAAFKFNKKYMSFLLFRFNGTCINISRNSLVTRNKVLHYSNPESVTSTYTLERTFRTSRSHLKRS